jgi:nucleotide-binding universal stress UspA family protein
MLTTVSIQKILVPTDFSRCAARALHFASDLARRYDATITLVHVDPDPTSEREADALESTARAAVADDGMPIDWKLLHGDPFAEIIDLAGDGDYNLIVMGTRGDVDHGRAYSITGAIVRNAPCPVVTVRSERGLS